MRQTRMLACPIALVLAAPATIYAAAAAPPASPAAPSPPPSSAPPPEIEDLFTRVRGYLGVVVIDLTPHLRTHFGAPTDAGVLVSEIVDGSPAEKAGVAVGDIVVGLDGGKIGSAGDVRRLVMDKKNGEQVKLSVIRDRKERTLTVAVVEREMPHVVVNRRGMGYCLPDLDPAKIEALVERATRESRVVVPRLREHRDALEKRLAELEAQLEKLERRLHNTPGGVPQAERL